jgi:hypothetical protein
MYRAAREKRIPAVWISPHRLRIPTSLMRRWLEEKAAQNVSASVDAV